jgi:hypothetical protein
MSGIGWRLRVNKLHSFQLFNKLIAFKISNDFDGWDVGLFSCKRIENEEGRKALRLVVWRLALFIQYK